MASVEDALRKAQKKGKPYKEIKVDRDSGTRARHEMTVSASNVSVKLENDKSKCDLNSASLKGITNEKEIFQEIKVEKNIVQERNASKTKKNQKLKTISDSDKKVMSTVFMGADKISPIFARFLKYTISNKISQREVRLMTIIYFESLSNHRDFLEISISDFARMLMDKNGQKWVPEKLHNLCKIGLLLKRQDNKGGKNSYKINPQFFYEK